MARVLGIDSSTLGIAYTIIDAESSVSVIEFGMINLTKLKEVQDKLTLAASELGTLLDEYKPDHVYVEMPIFVRNPDTARKLSFVVGCIMTVCGAKGYKVVLVEPATWKSFTGYKNLRKAMVQSAEAVLGKTEGKKFCDTLRKVQTSRAISIHYPDLNMEYTDDNIVDSCAIALYGVNKEVHRITFDKSIQLFTPSEIDILGI